MAWYEGLSSLKGQISNLTREIVVPNILPDTEEAPTENEKYLHDLEAKCRELQTQVEKLERENQRKNSDEGVDWDSFKWDDSSESGGGWAEDDFQDVYLGQDGPEVEQNDFPISRKKMAKIISEKNKLDHKCKLLDQERITLLNEMEELKTALNYSTLGKDSSNRSHNEEKAECVPAETLQVRLLQEEIKKLNADKVQLRAELASMTTAIQDLESQVAVTQDENANLSTGLEELDMEHQQAIEKIMTLKNSALRELEQLQTEHAELKSLYDAELIAKETLQISRNTSIACQTDEVSMGMVQDSLNLDEAPINGKIKNTGNNQSVIPDEYFADLTSGSSAMLPEENLGGKSKQVSQLECKLRETKEELEAVERENMALLEKVNSLRAACETLAPIAEGNEQLEALEQKVSSLEEEVQVLREVRANLEVELAAYRLEGERRNSRTTCSPRQGQQQQPTHLQDNLQNEIAQLRDQLDAAQRQHQLELETASSNHQQLIENEQLNTQLSQQCASLKDEIESLKLNESDRTCQKCESKERQMCQLILEKSVSDNNLEIANRDLIDMKRTCAELKEELSLRDAQLNDFLQLKSQLESTTSDQKKTNELLQKKYCELQSQYSSSVEDNRRNLDTLEEKSDEIMKLHTKCKRLEADNLQLVEKEKEKSYHLSSTAKMEDFQSKLVESSRVIKTMEIEKLKITDELNNLQIELDAKNKTLQTLEQRIAEQQSVENQIREKLSKIELDCEEKKNQIQELQKIVEKHDECLESLRILSQTTHEFEKKNSELEKRCKDLEVEAEQKLPQLLMERDQLIGSLQTKHTECLEYHSEIQRLNKFLFDELSKNAQLTSDISTLTDTCTDLKQQFKDKEENLQHQADEITSLRVQVESLQSQLDYASQLLRVDDRQEAEGQPSSDVDSNTDSKNEYVLNLEKDQSALAGSLLQEQTRNKYLQNEVQEQHEKEVSLMKEIERLRVHLINVEDNYTQEMIKTEKRVQELQKSLSLANEKVKNSSTAYTSVSIRANQQVEALQAQMKVMAEHQQQLEGQLSTSEDKLQKQAAALTNLQIVLEQFQKDKEKDISLETERLKESLQVANNDIARLKKMTESLQTQLAEAKEGLSAASRLDEQLEIKQQIIVDLNTKLQQVSEKLLETENKMKCSNSGVEGKVDRYLVKNLLVGLLRVDATAQSKEQALKVISTVLDFNHEERQRIGLEVSSTSDIIKQQSLSEAFVRFLENESQPQPHLKLPAVDLESESRRRSSTTASPSALLSDVAFSNLSQFSSSRSGTILKDVMKDNRLV